MKRTTSTAKTRGMITRIITRTEVVFTAYDNIDKVLTDLNVTFDAKIPEDRVIQRAIKEQLIATARYKVLDVKSVEYKGALYAMDVTTFIENAECIEENIED